MLSLVVGFQVDFNFNKEGSGVLTLLRNVCFKRSVLVNLNKSVSKDCRSKLGVGVKVSPSLSNLISPDVRSILLTLIILGVVNSDISSGICNGCCSGIVRYAENFGAQC